MNVDSIVIGDKATMDAFFSITGKHDLSFSMVNEIEQNDSEKSREQSHTIRGSIINLITAVIELLGMRPKLESEIMIGSETVAVKESDSPDKFKRFFSITKGIKVKFSLKG